MEKGLEDPDASEAASVGGLGQDDAHSQGGGHQPWTAPRHLLQAGSSTTSSPFDCMKSCSDRASSLGFTPTRLSDSFGVNQGFPKACHNSSQQLSRRLESPCLPRPGEPPCLNWSVAWERRGGSRMVQSPSKAWAIITAEDGKVLVCNSVLSSLLGHKEEELRDTVLWSLVVRREAAGQKSNHALDQLELDPDTGETVSCSGKVVRLRTREGSTVPVSLTVRKLADHSRVMVLLEPVTRTVGHISIGPEGTIVSIDPEAEALFQVRGGECIGGLVERLLPGLQLPEAGSKSRQALVGEVWGEEGGSFPLSCLAVRDEQGGFCNLTVRTYSSLSGLLLLDKEGKVKEADPAFSSLVLGFSPSGLEGRRIDDVIPGFYEEFEVPSCDRTEESLGCSQLSPSSPSPPLLVGDEQMAEEVSHPSPLEEINLNTGRQSGLRSEPCSPMIRARSTEEMRADLELVNLGNNKENWGEGESSPLFKRPSSLCVKTPVRIPMDVFTSTPACKAGRGKGLDGSRRNRSAESPMPTGCFYGLARHFSGADVAVLYQVKRVVLRDSTVVHCVWVTRDTDETGKTTLGLSLGTTWEGGEPTQPPSPTLASLTSGPYAAKYGTLDQLGQGAFGSVRLAYKLDDRELVVTKFIIVAKVAEGGWVDGERGERTPFEASLLSSLDHPGIVKVLDVFQNPSYVQMVMEKHGDMDLFEFIDRNPVMDEPLSCLIFRQVVSAVDFLHTRSILHRDIKDENIIIDHRFSCKLIDFGSAVFFKPGQRFHTFYGTVEYCSPEVLQGCSYEGPELELWSLGVLLYIIIFGENPFYDSQDTIRAELHPPHNDVSPKCWDLIQALLEKNPDHRASLWHLKEHEWILQEVDASQYQLYDVIPCSESELRPPTHYREEGGRMAGRAGQAFSRSSGLAGDHHLLGDSQDPSLELSSLESNVISNVSSTGVDVGSHLGASNLMDEQL